MTNLFASDEERDFFVYVDPNDWLIQHQIGLIGSFGTGPVTPSDETLMFLPNPDFKTFISPFQNNLLSGYVAEYNLELARERSFSTYPCRLRPYSYWKMKTKHVSTPSDIQTTLASVHSSA